MTCPPLRRSTSMHCSPSTQGDTACQAPVASHKALHVVLFKHSWTEIQSLCLVQAGGSCRIPAGMTGTVGFRPTTGCWNAGDGIVPMTVSRDTVGGPLIIRCWCCDLSYEE